MDREDKKNLALGVLLIVVIAASLVYFFWGFINEGYVEISAEAPFTVGLLGGEKYPCTSSPCTIALESGITEVILEKENHKGMVETVEVPLRRTAKLKIKFTRLPNIVLVDEIPSAETKNKYAIEFDNSNKMYKLVESDDEQKKALIYFQKKLKSPEFFGDGSILLVLEPSGGLAYKIDLVLKKREQINSADLEGIESGEWSNNGKYLLYKRASTPNYWIYSEGRTRETKLSTNYSRAGWALSDTLVFITQQETQSQLNVPLESINGAGFTVGKYDPNIDAYISAERFDEINELPEALIPASNGAVIYFKISSGKYQVNL